MEFLSSQKLKESVAFKGSLKDSLKLNSSVLNRFTTPIFSQVLGPFEDFQFLCFLINTTCWESVAPKSNKIFVKKGTLESEPEKFWGLSYEGHEIIIRSQKTIGLSFYLVNPLLDAPILWENETSPFNFPLFFEKLTIKLKEKGLPNGFIHLTPATLEIQKYRVELLSKKLKENIPIASHSKQKPKL